MLAKLFLKPANLLVMDEPTNDLDVETLELLEEQLLAYSGTLLLVSHDREFLDNVVTSTFAMDGEGGIAAYPGGYEDYARQSAAAKAAREPSAQKPVPQAGTRAVTSEKGRGGRRLSYNEQRELAALPERIDALEREIAAIEADLSSGKIYSSDRYAPAQAELEAMVERWAELAERQESEAK